MSTLFDLKRAFATAPRPEKIRVAAVVLAAGSSRRMGERYKLLLDVGGEPMIRRTVRNVLAFAPVETVVVTGHRAEAVEAALTGLPVKTVRNPDHAEGQPTSVVAGVRALSLPCDAVMIVLGDQPQVTAADLADLVAAYGRLGAESILVPHHDGRRGNPIVFAVRHVPEVLSGAVNVGCRHLIETHAEEVARVEMASDAFTLDCDTPDDYERLVERLRDAP
jgi:molybdenum cofactor cytidylyltransferase